MNEIVNYDPSNYHTSMTRSVYVKLDGSMLRISQTNARIPKRAMWNEMPIDRKAITFTKHRYYDLLAARIEMCPRGLARKRYFSRKYPIQLTVKSMGGATKIDGIDGQHLLHGNADERLLPAETDLDCGQPGGLAEDFDFASTVLLSDVSGR